MSTYISTSIKLSLLQTHAINKAALLHGSTIPELVYFMFVHAAMSKLYMFTDCIVPVHAVPKLV